MVFKFKSKTKAGQLQLTLGVPPKEFAACFAVAILLVTGHAGPSAAPAQDGAEAPATVHRIVE